MTIEQHGKVRSVHNIHHTAVAEEFEERGWLPDFFQNISMFKQFQTDCPNLSRLN